MSYAAELRREQDARQLVDTLQSLGLSHERAHEVLAEVLTETE